MKDFFISYNKADRRWAVDCLAAREHRLYDRAPRLGLPTRCQFLAGDARCYCENQVYPCYPVARLSRRLLYSVGVGCGYARDPMGKQRLLVPVRVRNCDPQGLLHTLIFIDLVDLDETKAKGFA